MKLISYLHIATFPNNPDLIQKEPPDQHSVYFQTTLQRLLKNTPNTWQSPFPQSLNQPLTSLKTYPNTPQQQANSSKQSKPADNDKHTQHYDHPQPPQTQHNTIYDNPFAPQVCHYISPPPSDPPHERHRLGICSWRRKRYALGQSDDWRRGRA